MNAVDVIAHRGASAYSLEHTFEAYDLALTMGADVLEIDVRMTADGTLVALHDPPGPTVEARPLTLAAVVDRYGAGTRYLLDLKQPVEREVVELVAGHGLRDHVEIQS